VVTAAGLAGAGRLAVLLVRGLAVLVQLLAGLDRVQPFRHC